MDKKDIDCALNHLRELQYVINLVETEDSHAINEAFMRMKAIKDILLRLQQDINFEYACRITTGLFKNSGGQK